MASRDGKPIPLELAAVVMPEGHVALEWAPAKDAPSQESRKLQEEIYERYREQRDTWLLFLGLCSPAVPLSPSLDYWRRFAGRFARDLRLTPDLESLRHRVRIPVSEATLRDALEELPPMIGAEYLDRGQLRSVWSDLNKAFCRAVEGYEGTVQSFLRTFGPEVHLLGRIYFHLVENKGHERPFAFLATYTPEESEGDNPRHLPLKHALQAYGGDRERLLKLLSTVYQAARSSELVAGLLETRELFHPLAWPAGKAFRFLKEIPLYEEAGIACRIPDWWKGGSASVRMSVRVGDAPPSYLGMEALLSVEADLAVDGVPVSPEEARRLLEETEGLALIKNRWVAVDPEKLRRTLDAYEKARKMARSQGLSLREALRLQLQPDKVLGLDARSADLKVSSGQWLESVLDKLRDPGKAEAVSPGPGFQGRLRPYQQRGLHWLWLLHRLRFGACLADDMGLGKTVQLLAFLSVLKDRDPSPDGASLLILPASLIANWVDEIHRFYPSLRYAVAHPSAFADGRVPELDPSFLEGIDLVITTYALAKRYDWLRSREWRYVVLDEAQAIKNPGTKQTRAVKELPAENRIAMTGTPLENRLSDLWSLFDFLNPGLLGNRTEFTRFSKTLRDDPGGYARLRRLVSPYLLRRLKTDRDIVADLPEKIEMKTWASPSRKQAVLYQNLVKEMQRVLADVDNEDIQRKGLILSAIMKFKQLCNHPDQYLGAGGFEEKDSGKFLRLREICETVYEKRERVLVFTQFKEMTKPLHDFLATIFERPGLVLHGSVAVGQRRKIIERFQDGAYTPFMVLSLKAGGVGLNLTRANHVVHFDRWWNPAVENQATDRAFRIGQRKNVLVHKLITRGTVEEKIDAMLEAKTELSDQVVAVSGENLVTEMKNEELMELFRLTL